MILPMPWPDETVASVLTRMCRLNGIADFCDIAPMFFFDSPCVSFVDAVIDLPKFCRRTKYAYGDSVSLLQDFTWLGLLNRFGGVADEEIRGISEGTIKPTLSRLTFVDSTVLRFCPTCRLIDIELFGVSYWHRLHQIPVVFYCPTHGDRLVSSEVKRRRLHQSFILPGDCDAQRVDSISMPLADTNFWQGVSTIAQRFVGEQLPYDENTIRAAIIDGLQERGLAKSNGFLRTSELVSQLIARVETLPAESLSLNKILFAKRIAKSINVPEQGMAFGRLVLIYWLFGTWGDFLERCCWVNVFGTNNDLAAPSAKLDQRGKSPGEYHRERCEVFLNEHLGCSRLDLTRAEYRSFRWLLHYDSSWLDQLFPLPPGRSKQLSLFDPRRGNDRGSAV